MNWVKVIEHLNDNERHYRNMSLGAETSERARHYSALEEMTSVTKDALIAGMSEDERRAYIKDTYHSWDASKIGSKTVDAKDLVEAMNARE